MKTYFYFNYVRDTRTNDLYLFDLKPFFEAFTKKDTRMSSKNGEPLFLFPVPGLKNFYEFACAKNPEDYLRIVSNASGVTVSDMTEHLKSNSKKETEEETEEDVNLGVSAFLYLDEKRNILTYATRAYAPTFADFKDYVNRILSNYNVFDFKFEMKSLEHNITKEEATELPFIGRTSIKVDPQHDLYQHISQYLFETAFDKEKVGEIEVILKPDPRQNIRDSARSAMLKLKDTGLIGIHVRGIKAGGEKEGQKDFRVKDLGTISEEITLLEKGSIKKEMAGYLEKNMLIQEKYDLALQENEFEKEELEELTKYYDPAEW